LILNAARLLDWSIVQHEHDLWDASPETFFIEIF
jgi:hypothetical protein